MSFWCLQFLPKNERNKLTRGIIVVKLNLFVRFFGKNIGLKKSFGLCLTFDKDNSIFEKYFLFVRLDLTKCYESQFAQNASAQNEINTCKLAAITGPIFYIN